MLGPLWIVVVIGMLSTLLVVFALRARRSGVRPSLVVLGVAIGVVVAGLAALATVLDRT